MAAGRKLTEIQRQAVIADYAMLRSYAAVARKHGISPSTCRAVVRRGPRSPRSGDGAAALRAREEETVRTVLEYIESTAGRQADIIDKMLGRMADPEAVAGLDPTQAARIYGMLVDRAGAFTETGGVHIRISFGSGNSAEDLSKFNQ